MLVALASTVVLFASAEPPPEALYQQHKFAECAVGFHRRAASDRITRRSGDLWNAASCEALSHNPDAALHTLGMAFDAAVLAHDPDSFDALDADPDFASLKADPRWKTLKTAISGQLKAYRARNNEELRALYADDQKDRQNPPLPPKKVAARDQIRRTRVAAILLEKGAKTADDYFHAAMIFQHGDGTEDIAKANKLALKAVDLDTNFAAARWLAAASEDRLLVRQHKPQKYGTQSGKKSPTSPWVMDPVDPSVTDDDRAKWNVPPLAEEKAQVEAMNKLGPIPH